MSLIHLLDEVGLSQRQAARELGFRKSFFNRVMHGRWPARTGARLRMQLEGVLTQRGATPEQIQTAFETAPNAPTTSEIDTMLMRNEALTLEARQHFKLPRSPFVDDVATPADVFQTPSVRYVRAALMDCAQHHGFIAVVGESGAGKSTLAEDLEERIKAGSADVAVIRPYVQGMELNDAKGKTMKSGHLAEALTHALDPIAELKSSPQARFQQLHDKLKTSARAGRRHLLLIEEAHCLPTATLKHLKRFLELKDGMRRLLGVALIAQPELLERLNSQSAEVREVMQRLEIVRLDPLDGELEGYLSHKFARFNLKIEDVLAPEAIDAIRARLIHLPRGGRQQDARSICYPLVVNNLICRAMNAAARAAWPKVDAQVIAGC
ncbi:AAA family ATPase [Roseateles sp. DAIF2]|uniref:ExeA family protein n=1 Tax=Roseateles sp. DAIF2 TaxID=2714952 RepID=UPI0018A26814|nr:AAA family ATPase [Roseateles sp. DAIF2]QPF74210.1 AAA family ATPase [Roseateles sp. DAIF2]